MKILSTISLIILWIMTNPTLAQEYLPDYDYKTYYTKLDNGYRIAYLDEGPKEAPVLLMVHGLGGYIKNWYPTIEGLKSDFRCIAIDLPGYGRSTIKNFEADDYMVFFARSVDGFVKSLELEEVNLLGHSMGGQVSIVAALDEPDWLNRLILAAPAGFETFSETEAQMLKGATAAANLMAQNEDQIRAAYAINFVKMPEAVEDMIQDRLMAREADWFEAYAKVREKGVKSMLDHPVRADLAKIQVPTLVLFGKQDQLIPNRYLHANMTTGQIAEEGKDIPDVTIEMIDQAGHMLQMDNPEDFNQAIMNYLKN